MVTIHADPAPVEAWPDGSIRVGGTRLLLALVVDYYERGETPQQIAAAFAMPEQDILGALAYYARHREELNEYFARRAAEADELRKRVESEPGYAELIERIKRAHTEGE
ncbi:MAG: DUF433 domain-containing protein [Tepidiformaceae bacterium]